MTDFAGVSGELILNHAFGLVLILARVGATLAFLPGLGESTIPAVVNFPRALWSAWRSIQSVRSSTLGTVSPKHVTRRSRRFPAASRASVS